MSDVVYPDLPRLKAGDTVVTPVGQRVVAWQVRDKVTVVNAAHFNGLKAAYEYKDFNRREVKLVE